MTKKSFYRRKVIIQILFPTIISIVLIYIGYFLSISHIKELLLEQRKQQAKEMVNSIYNMIEEYYKQVEQGKLSRTDAQSTIILNIENLRYGEDSKDYYWIINYNNEILAHPFFNDTVAPNNSDNEFRKTLSEMVELVKEKTKGYHEYNWQWKDDSTRIEKKNIVYKRI